MARHRASRRPLRSRLIDLPDRELEHNMDDMLRVLVLVLVLGRLRLARARAARQRPSRTVGIRLVHSA